MSMTFAMFVEAIKIRIAISLVVATNYKTLIATKINILLCKSLFSQSIFTYLFKYIPVK